MKNISYSILLCCVGCFFISTNVNGQERYPESKHEIRAQVSDGFPLTITEAFIDVFSDLAGNRDSEDISGTAHFGVGYRYHFRKNFSAGLDLSYQKVTNHFTYASNDSGNPEKKGEDAINMILIMPAAAFKYIHRPKFQLYGNVAAGLAIGSSEETVADGAPSIEDSTTGFAFQINPIGVRVGRKIAGFAELGFGYRGIITVGLSVNL